MFESIKRKLDDQNKDNDPKNMSLDSSEGLSERKIVSSCGITIRMPSGSMTGMAVSSESSLVKAAVPVNTGELSMSA